VKGITTERAEEAKRTLRPNKLRNGFNLCVTLRFLSVSLRLKIFTRPIGLFLMNSQ
jgi:hypothetical protein